MNDLTLNDIALLALKGFHRTSNPGACFHEGLKNNTAVDTRVFPNPVPEESFAHLYPSMLLIPLTQESIALAVAC